MTNPAQLEERDPAEVRFDQVAQVFESAEVMGSAMYASHSDGGRLLVAASHSALGGSDVAEFAIQLMKLAPKLINHMRDIEAFAMTDTSIDPDSNIYLAIQKASAVLNEIFG